MEQQRDDDLEFSRIVFLLKRRAWVPLLVAAIAALVAFGYSSSQVKLYKATAEVNAVDQGYGLFRNSGDLEPQRDVDNALYLIQSRAVQDPATEQLGDAASSVHSVSASTAADTDLVMITAVAESPEVAADAANVTAKVYVEQQEAMNVQARRFQAETLRATADSYDEQVKIIDQSLVQVDPTELESLRLQRSRLIAQQADLRQRANEFDAEAELKSGAIRVVVPAEAPSDSFAPTPLKDALLAALVGLFLGVAAVIVFDWINSRVSLPEEASRLTDSLPVVGTIPLEGRRLKRHRLPKGARSLAAPGSATEEAYRSLATNVRFTALGRQCTVIAVTSASEGEGKTTTVANLAKALAESGSNVAVVSADLRRPSMGEAFGVDESTAGLTSVLLDELALIDAVVSVPLGAGAPVIFLPSGQVPANPQAALASDAMGSILGRLEQGGADIILLDTAPVLPVGDTLALVHHCDAVLLCVVPNGTKKTYLQEAVNRLRRMGAEILGMNFDGVHESTLEYYGQRSSSYTADGSGTGAASLVTEPTSPQTSPNGSNGSNGSTGPSASTWSDAPAPPHASTEWDAPGESDASTWSDAPGESDAPTAPHTSTESDAPTGSNGATPAETEADTAAHD